MSADLTLRPVEPADLPALQEVRRAAFAPVFESFRKLVGDELYALALSGSDAEQAALLESLCAAEKRDRMLVALVDGRIIGFVSYELNRETRIGEIGLNAVHPDFAGRSFGTQMYEQVLERMKDAGMQVATVGTGGDPSHAPARRAYEKVGFDAGIPSVYLYKRL